MNAILGGEVGKQLEARNLLFQGHPVVRNPEVRRSPSENPDTQKTVWRGEGRKDDWMIVNEGERPVPPPGAKAAWRRAARLLHRSNRPRLAAAIVGSSQITHKYLCIIWQISAMDHPGGAWVSGGESSTEPASAAPGAQAGQAQGEAGDDVNGEEKEEEPQQDEEDLAQVSARGGGGAGLGFVRVLARSRHRPASPSGSGAGLRAWRAGPAAVRQRARAGQDSDNRCETRSCAPCHRFRNPALTATTAAPTLPLTLTLSHKESTNICQTIASLAGHDRQEQPAAAAESAPKPKARRVVRRKRPRMDDKVRPDWRPPTATTLLQQGGCLRCSQPSP